MKQVIQSSRTGILEVKEVPAPTVSGGELLVQTKTSLISSGTERMLVDFAKKSLLAKARTRPDLMQKVLTKAKVEGFAETFKAVMSRLDEPLPLGYSAAGIVLEVGSGLEGAFRVGDRVATAGAGISNHAEKNVVPRNLAAVIPEDVPDEEASYGTLASIALHAVRNLEAKLGETVAVIGVGLVGQLACQLLRLGGARAIALDYNDNRLETVLDLGAELSIGLHEPDVAERVISHTSGRGCDGIMIAAATSSNIPFKIAAAIARDRAKICLVGQSGTKFSYAPFMQKELTILVSRSYGPGRYDVDYESRDTKYPEGYVRWTETDNLMECLRLMSPTSTQRLDVASLTTHRFNINEAENAYRLVTENSEPHLGVLIAYPNIKKVAAKPARFPEVKIAGESCVLGLIGAGNFARRTLLPELSKVSGVTLHTIMSKHGASAEHSQKKFGFTYASTNEKDILYNPAINAVLIASRHDSHARLTVEALSAGKSVLVEKPLGLNTEQVEEVRLAREKADGFFQVGFNRRFAPLSIQAKSALASVASPKFLMIRINAGPIPTSSWHHVPNEGGGRIIGEMCHFIDLARFFVDAPIVSVMADTPRTKIDPCDDVSATLRFEDGSLAVVAYTSLGNTAYPKECYEIYAGGSVMALENFRTLVITTSGKTRKFGGRQDKGFKGSLRSFVAAVKSGGPAPIDEREYIETSLATLAVMDSLRTGRRIEL